MVEDGAFSHKIYYVAISLGNFKSRRASKSQYWWKNKDKFAEGVNFSYWWSFISAVEGLQVAEGSEGGYPSLFKSWYTHDYTPRGYRKKNQLMNGFKKWLTISLSLVFEFLKPYFCQCHSSSMNGIIREATQLISFRQYPRWWEANRLWLTCLLFLSYTNKYNFTNMENLFIKEKNVRLPD